MMLSEGALGRRAGRATVASGWGNCRAGSTALPRAGTPEDARLSRLAVGAPGPLPGTAGCLPAEAEAGQGLLHLGDFPLMFGDGLAVTADPAFQFLSRHDKCVNLRSARRRWFPHSTVALVVC